MQTVESPRFGAGKGACEHNLRVTITNPQQQQRQQQLGCELDNKYITITCLVYHA